MPRLFKRVAIRFGEPLEPARYGDRPDDHLALREYTDEIMYEIAQLSRLRVRRHVRDPQGRGRALRSRATSRPTRKPTRSPPPPLSRAPSRGSGRPRGASRPTRRRVRSRSSPARTTPRIATSRSRSPGASQTPSAIPARNAAPSAVVSWIAARRTGTPSTSAWNWHSRSMTRRAAVDAQLRQRRCRSRR